MTTEEKIIRGFIEFVLLNGRSPYSPLELTKKLKIDESIFYQHFTSLEKVEQAIPLSLLKQTLAILDADPQYAEFSAREKLLAVFYTLFEQFQTQRSYLVLKYNQWLNTRSDWKPFADALNERVDGILSEAKEADEIKDRAIIGAHFSKGYKLVFSYIFRVWLKDDSVEFANTDAAIEKTVNTSFDMLGKTALDSLVDFGKFAFKTKFF